MLQTLPLYPYDDQDPRGRGEAWEKLAEEKKEDGSPKYIHAADNAQFWRELDADLRKILRDLEG